MAKKKAKKRNGKAVWLTQDLMKRIENNQRPRETYSDTVARLLKRRK